MAAQSASIRALLFHRPPGALLETISSDAVIGVYNATPYEAPANGYARFFQERGHTIALPRFVDPAAPMEFAEHTDPFGLSDLVPGPFDLHQPASAAPAAVPEVLFVPLIGFTPSGKRLGQGGGHYDRWLAKHPETRTIGLAWDVQLVEPDEELPTEAHDITLDCVVTPTRMYGAQ